MKYFRELIGSLLILISCLSPLQSIAQITSAPSDEVDAIIELDQTEFEIFSNTKAIERIHRVITVFNENGREYGDIKISESNFRKCKDIKGKILDLNNNVIKKLQKDDIIESNVNYDYEIAVDERFKKFNLTWNSFPYKIDYQYEIKHNTIFFWPDWMPQQDDTVLKSTYILKLHQPISYSTHAVGIQVEPQKTTDKNTTVLVWKLDNISKRIREDYMPPENRIQMALFFTPTHFQLDKYMGSFESWAKFGKWCAELSKGQQNLPPDAIIQIQELTAESKSPLEKIQKIYSFLQSYTRYVAIELGIGGWQPYSADWVFNNKYGDCKDLTNFMIAMLNQAGINAYPALIRTRERGVVYPEFPMDYFNHVISVVPLEDDTLWLECTADHLPAGRLSDHTEGCYALVIKENGGEIVCTPDSKAEDNVWKSHLKGEIRLSGQLILKGAIQTTGNFGIDWRDALIWNKGEDQKDLLIHVLSRHVPRIGLSDYQLKNINENYDQPVQIIIEGSVPNYASVGGSRLFVAPAAFNRFSASYIPDEDPENRHFAVFRRFPYTIMDSVEIQLPFGYSLEASPGQQSIVASFGEYKTDYRIENRMLKYYRFLKIAKRLIPVDQYAEYKAFVQEVVKNDVAKFVFKKNKG